MPARRSLLSTGPDPFLTHVKLEEAYMMYRTAYNCQGLSFLRPAHYILYRLGLAKKAFDNSTLRWAIRPKQHQAEHMCRPRLFLKHVICARTPRLFDFCGRFGNAKYFGNYLNEDLMGRGKRLGLLYLSLYPCCATNRPGRLSDTATY